MSYVERARELAKKYDSAAAWSDLADCLLYEEDASAALEAALIAHEKVKQNGEDWSSNVLFQLMECCRKLGDQENASKYADEFYHELEKEYSYNKQSSAIGQYMDDINAGVENAYRLAMCEIAKNNLKEAGNYLKWMRSRPMCPKCTHESCHRIFEIQGYLHEARGEKEQALECYQKVLAAYQGDRDIRHRIEGLKKEKSIKKEKLKK